MVAFGGLSRHLLAELRLVGICSSWLLARSTRRVDHGATRSRGLLSGGRSGNSGQLCVLIGDVKDVAIFEAQGRDRRSVTPTHRLPKLLILEELQLLR